MIQTCMALLAVVIYVGIIDRVGRRLPICIVYTILTVVLWIIGGLYYSQSKATQNVLVSIRSVYLLITRSRWSACGSLAFRSIPSRTMCLRRNSRHCS